MSQRQHDLGGGRASHGALPAPLLCAGGHGVGWSEIPRYAFKVAAGWEETPVSIAGLHVGRGEWGAGNL